jgi:heat shock protein HslJ
MNLSKNETINLRSKTGSELKKNARVVAGLPSLAIVISFAACSEIPTSPSLLPAAGAGSAAVVDGSSWKLQSLTRADSTVATIGEPDRFTLAFGDGNRINLRADCNNAFGGYATKGNTLAVGPLASTKAYCASAPLDDEYLRAISGESTITVTSTTLTMSSSRGTLQFGK